MFDQMQVIPSVQFLSALLEYPEFQRGLAEGHEEFLGSYEPAPLTEEEMIDEVEMNLSRRITERSKLVIRLLCDDCEPSSYLFNLGFVVGTIDKGLTYTR